MSRAAVFAVVALLAACKGDRQKCEQACRNYGTLVYWDTVDKQVSAAPADQRDALKKKKLAEFSSQLENGIDMCVDQCASANNDKQTDCMINAKSSDVAKKCIE
jgi:hypothetical protein